MQIADWESTFETAESRRLKVLTWIAMPVGFHSAGYHSLLDEFGDNAAGVYGAWCALCSLAGSCPARGRLTSSKGVSYSISRIARETHLAQHWFEKLIPWALAQGWLIATEPDAEDRDASEADVVDSADPEKHRVLGNPQQSPSERPADPQQPPSESRGIPGLQDLTGQDLTGQDRGGGESDSVESPPAAAGTPPCPADEIVAEFNGTFGLQCRLTPKRRKQLTTRWRDPHWREHWQEALSRAGPSKFLRGQNDRGWQIDLEFFLRPDTLDKILEGKYDNRNSNTTGGTRGDQRLTRVDSAADLRGRKRVSAEEWLSTASTSGD